jgi:hypothetical protein
MLCSYASSRLGLSAWCSYARSALGLPMQTHSSRHTALRYVDQASLSLRARCVFYGGQVWEGKEWESHPCKP